MPILPLLRDELPAYWAGLGLTKTGVEVGTYRGNFAECWLSQWPGTLHCVDPWLFQPDQADLLNHSQDLMDAVHAEATQRLAPYASAGRCQLHRMPSVEGAMQDWAHDLDVVYLDARHDYPYILLDLVSWYPRVKPGGIIAGHDYLDGQQGPTLFGVKRAVDQFFTWQGYDLERDLFVNGDPYPTWQVLVKG